MNCGVVIILDDWIDVLSSYWMIGLMCCGIDVDGCCSIDVQLIAWNTVMYIDIMYRGEDGLCNGLNGRGAWNGLNAIIKLLLVYL